MASARNQSLSINMVMNSAIKGANFLQVSVNKLYKNATTVQKIDLLKATKFPLLNRNLKSLDNHLGKIRSQSAKISANPIRLDISASRNSLKNARKDMTAIQHDAKQVAFWTKKSADNLRVGANVQKRASSHKRNASAGVGVASGVGMGYLLSKPFKASIEFESNMADVKALTKNLTNDDFILLQEKAKELGAKTEWSASQSALGMTYLAKAGFDAKQQLGAMEGVLGLATAGSVDLATSSDIASNVLSGFGIEANKMGMVSDVLAKTFTTSNTDLLMLGETMKYTAPIASGLGVSITEVSALAGKLGDVGIQGSMAGTSLRQMYTRLSAPPKEAEKALDSLGISVFDAQGKFKGMPNIVGELNKAMAGMDDGVKTEKLKHIFGMTALSSGIALMKVGKKGLLDYKSTLDNSTGTTAKIQEIKLDTTAGEFKLLGSAMESLSISATTGLLPTIRLITSGFKTVAGSVETFTKKYPDASKWVFGLGSAFVVGSIALASFGFVASGVATAVGFISLPVLAVVGAIGLVVAGGVALYKNWDIIKAKSSVIWNEIVTKIKSPFVSMFNWLNEKFQKVIDLKNKVLNLVGLGDDDKSKEPKDNKSFFDKTKSFFGFGSDEKKETLQKPTLTKNVPVNNTEFKSKKSTPFKTSFLREIPAKRVELESPSKLSEIAINEQKTQMQLKNDNKKEIMQNITNHITVNSVDGKIDEDDLYEKLARVQRKIADDDKDIDLRDVS